MSKHTSRAGALCAGRLAATTAIVATAMLVPEATKGAVFGPVTMDAVSALAALEEKLQALVDESQGIIAAADEAEQDPSEDDLATIEANTAEIEKLKRQIAARKSLLPAAGPGRRTTAEPANRADPANPGQRTRVPANARQADPRGGFASFGQFAAATRHGSIQGNEPDERLRNAATTYGNEGVGADGGFLVPPEFAREIWKKVEAEENLLNRCAELMTGTNNMTIPKDETAPWDHSNGIRVTWEGEAQAATQSKPAFEMSTIRLVKLMALVPLSDELVEDAVGLESWLNAKAPAKMAAKINTAIVDGTGAGQPLGILRSPSTISVAKETSQAADSIWFPNVSNMWSRMYGPWRRNAIWLINQDAEPQLDRMAFDPLATDKFPVYLPSGGLSASPYATLKGRPVVPVEACKTLGDKGDIILVDLKQYWGLKKASGIRSDTSIHLYFDQAATAFRFIFRMNGQPAWSAAISPENGSLTRSWAVTLDARA